MRRAMLTSRPPGGAGLIASLGTIEAQNAGTNNWQMGWEFQVGASPITVSSLRIYLPVAATKTVTLWRVSDSSSLASVSIAATADSWSVGSISPTVLSAGANYIVSADLGPSSDYYRTPTPPTATLRSGATYVAGRYGTTSGVMPNTTANRFYGITDIIFS